MKKLLLVLIAALAVSFTAEAQKVVLIGKVNMISNKNVVGDMGNYTQLAAYARGSEKKIEKAKAENIEQAIEATIKDVPGGVFLMNAKIYRIKGKYYAVEGDVWGLKQNANYKGFSVGDKVMWKTAFTGYKYGVIVAVKDSEECIVKDNEDGKEKKIKFTDLMRAD